MEFPFSRGDPAAQSCHWHLGRVASSYPSIDSSRSSTSRYGHLFVEAQFGVRNGGSRRNLQGEQLAKMACTCARLITYHAFIDRPGGAQTRRAQSASGGLCLHGRNLRSWTAPTALTQLAAGVFERSGVGRVVLNTTPDACAAGIGLVGA